MEKVTLLTIPGNYPSRIFPWNRNVNSVVALGDVKETTEVINSEKEKVSIASTIVTNLGNNQEKVLEIFTQGNNARDFELVNHSLEQSKIIYSSLKKSNSHYYAGRYAEYVGSVRSNLDTEKALDWCKKAAISYFEEANFWQGKQVPFIASHAFKDFEKCLTKYGQSIVDEPKILVLKEQIFSKLPQKN